MNTSDVSNAAPEAVDEFMEVAKGSAGKKARASLFAPIDDDNDEGDKAGHGQPEQWAINGPGFVPVGSTAKKLPAGVYRLSVVNNQVTLVSQAITTDDLLRLPDSKSDMVIGEIERFWQMKGQFRKFGFSFKRGFLLWGPPGSGKTSTLAFITKQVVKDDGLVLHASSFAPGDVASMLQSLRKVEPERKLIVLMEDIDTVIARYGEANVLSLLDGEDSIDNVVFLATTNYPEHLDGRVINRPSRFDRVVKIDVPSPEARAAYLQSRALQLSEKDLDKWVAATDGFSIAHMKELIVGVFCYENKFEDEVKRLKSMARTPKSDSSDNAVGFGR